MRFVYSLILSFVLFHPSCIAQTDSLDAEQPVFHLSGYADIFYAYDFNEPTTPFRQAFLYHHNRHNEFNLNLGLIKLNITHSKYRANIALQSGTYPTDNYADEPDLLKHIFEANAGISLNKKNTLWIDAGIFASHLGFETAQSIDNWTLTHSLVAENSPYYLAGAKIGYVPNKTWSFTALVCNGWQRIQRLQGNTLPGFGTQLIYAKSEKMLINWSSFIGTDNPDSTRRMRYFNDVYGKFELSNKISLIAGFDIGTQQSAKGSVSYNTWFGPVLIARYTFNKRWAAAVRGEYYDDKEQVIITTKNSTGFQTTGVSLNLDYNPHAHVKCRIEGRWFNSRNKTFNRGDRLVHDNYFVCTSIAVRFGQ